MIRGLLNVASSALFISLLGFAMWWSRRGERQWTSPNGMRCICQMRISGDGLEHPWHEVRLLIIPSARAVAVTAKGHRGKLFRGTWNLLGTPHVSLIGDVAPDQQTFAVHKQGNNEQTAIVRMSSASASAVIMRNCLPEIS
ncbi:MAG: hypothetical protein WCH94_06735 [Actinomycetota bacterium]